MRLAILALAFALPLTATSASATAHDCAQLRQTIFNLAPPTTHDLPYAALTCAGVSQIHLILLTAGSQGQSRLALSIEAVFRREGLIR